MKKPQVMKQLISVILFVLFSKAAYSSSERLIDVDSAEFKSKAHNFSIVFTRDESTAIRQLLLTVNGLKIEVPKSEFEGITGVKVGSMSVSTATSLAKLPDKIDMFVVTIRYGEPVYHNKGEDDLLVSSLVRFVFTDTKYIRRERIIPAEGRENIWKSYEKGLDHPERFIGSIKSADYPLLTK